MVINRYQSNTGLSGVVLGCTDNSKARKDRFKQRLCRTARAAEQILASDRHRNLRGLAGTEVRAQPWSQPWGLGWGGGALIVIYGKNT